MSNRRPSAVISVLLCIALLLSCVPAVSAQEESIGAPTPSKSEIAATEEEIEQMECPFSETGKHVLGNPAGIYPSPNGNGYVRGIMNEREYEASCTRASGSSAERPCEYCFTWFTVLEDSRNPQAATGHVFSEETQTVSTCDGATYGAKTCTVCGYVEVRIISGTPDETKHQHTHEETVTANDCKTDISVKTVCEDCQAVLSCTDKGPAGHSGRRTTVQNGNCQTPFIREFKCYQCAYTLTEETPGSHIYTAKVTEPTCTEDGSRVWRCSVCGQPDPDRPQEEPIPALGHNFVDVESSACTDGKEQVCTRCGETKTVEGNGVIQHEWGPEMEQEPTCAKAGYRYHTCQKCGITEITQENTKEPVAHTFTQTKILQAPTCGAQGRSAAMCAVCGALGEETILPATGEHTPLEDDGDCTTAVHCSVCGEITEAARQQHDWVYRSIPSLQGAVKEHTKTCRYCHTKETELCAGADDGDCTTALSCDLCGAVIRGGSQHVPGAARVYVPVQGEENEYHIALCSHTGCEKTVQRTKAAHTYQDGICTVCGHEDGREHIPNGIYESDGNYHWQRCTQCGAKTEIAPHDKTATDPYAGDCTKAVACSVCEHIVRAADTHHYAGDWQTNSEEHFRTCVNPGCEHREIYRHVPQADDGDCTTPVVCQDCGITLAQGAAEHVWVLSPGEETEEGHTLRCAEPSCRQTKTEPHKEGLAATCREPAECAVCRTAYGQKNPENHVGERTLRNVRPATEEAEGYSGDLYCLGCETVVEKGEVIEKLPPSHRHEFNLFKQEGEEHVPMCACGETDETQRSLHIFGAFSPDGSEHIRQCTVCGAEDRQAHRESEEDYDCTTAVVCPDCGEILIPAEPSHRFEGAPVGMEEGHAHPCTNENCLVFGDIAPHTGGVASCEGGAHCEVCDYLYTEKDSSVHTGGTELRDVRHPTADTEGYTGNVYCLGCGEIIERGTVIEKLPPEHQHEFSEFESDLTHHWRVCACGETSDYEEHTFVNGTCSVCGAKEPAAPKPFVLGDLDGDGQSDIADALRLFKAVDGRILLYETEKDAADIDQNGTIDVCDALGVYLMANGSREDGKRA